mgnify:CR=1 FL=1
MIKALESCSDSQKKEMKRLMQENPSNKVEKTLALFRECGVDKWAFDLKDQYLNAALKHLEEMAVLSMRKEPLQQLAQFLVKREY